MKGIWQAMAIGCLLFTTANGQLAEPRWRWESIKVVQSVFPRDIGMLDSEREEYADNLVGLAVNQIRLTHGGAGSLAQARKMIALAMHLSPRNKRAVVSNFQLGKGMIPEAIDTDLSPQSFARLLLARGQLLEKQGGADNRLLTRYLYQLAAELAPKNEDAVYLSEIRRLDQGDVDWSLLTNPNLPQ